MIRHILRAVVLLLLLTGPAVADDGIYIGSLRNVEGNAELIRDGAARPATEGLRVLHGDRLKTGKDGRLGIVFRDDTRISLGPDSDLTVDDYVYEPAQEQFGLLVRLLRGTAAYISGAIGKLAPQTIQFKTPTATIGVRGTSFLVKAEEE